jgi:CRP-like cAMP-binding protein
VSLSELKGAVRRHPIWRHASDDGVVRLLRAAKDETFRPGQAVLSAGQPARAIHLLLDGAVRVFYPSKDGQAEVTVKLFWAPAAFGDAESILRTDWAETVQALTPARVLITDAAHYFRIMQSEPAVCFRQYWDVARRFGVAIHSEKSANLDEISDRVIALLVTYANHFGRAVDEGVLIDHAITQDDVATQVGSNRRTIVQVLASLYQKELLVRVGRRYLVPSVEALLASSKGEAPDLSFKTDDAPWAELPRE